MTNQTIQLAISITGSQKRLADLCGVAQPTVWRWLHGGGIDARYVMKIVSATGGKIKPADIRPDLAPLFNTSGFSPTAVINRSQTKQAPGHEKIRDAVRAWSAADNQDVVAALIVNEYREQGGGTIDFPDDVSRARQKLFRFLDNKFDSEKYRNNVRELTPAILAVLPLEYRGHLVEQDSYMARLAEMEKELSEAKQAVILNAPRHQKLKEMSEGIVSMFRVDPDLAGPLMAMVTTMLGAI
eukprot:gene12153-14865_t